MAIAAESDIWAGLLSYSGGPVKGYDVWWDFWRCVREMGSFRSSGLKRCVVTERLQMRAVLSVAGGRRGTLWRTCRERLSRLQLTSVNTHCLPEHFTRVMSRMATCPVSPHFTDKESKSGVDYFIVVSEDHTANEAGL